MPVVYDALAPIYDRMMNHVEYGEWAGLLEGVVKKFLQPIKSPSVFELGGGTGVLASLLKERGVDYFGSDRSFSMCKIARGRGVRFMCSDALAIPCKRRFDLIVFLYDGINYLQSIEEYSRLFAETAAHLVPGGLFLFDITTEANSLTHFQNYLEHEDWGDYAYVRHSYYHKERIEQHNDITIYRQVANDPAVFEKHVEYHCQKVFAASLIERAVPAELFSTIGIWDGFTFRRYHPHSERIHFLLKRAAP